jgi:enoyl-CoA hydratase
MTDAVLTEQRDRVLLVTLNRPGARNAINADITDGLVGAFSLLDGTHELSVGVLTGVGGCFCAGMDLKEFSRSGPPRGLARLLREGCAKPMIAAIEGHALGGGLELALTCDLLVASRTAELAIPEVRVGLLAAGGGLLRLPRHLPYALAAEIAFTGEPITAALAHHHGLVNHLSEPGAALGDALKLAVRVAGSAPLSLAATKAVLRGTQGRTEGEFWDYQGPWAKSVFNSADAREGARAFAEKRSPEWTGG